MTSQGFIQIPRSLLNDPLWIDLSPGYREVFIIILENACFRPQKFNDSGIIIELEPGQVCASIRQITKWLGKYGDKNIVERAIKRFVLCGFLRQEVRHTKSIFTISHKDTYESIKKASETGSETELRQFRDSFETQKKKDKKDKNEKKEEEHVDAGASTKITPISSLSNELVEESKHNIYYQDINGNNNKVNKPVRIKSKLKITNPESERLVSLESGKIEVCERVFLSENDKEKLLTLHGLTTYNQLIEKLSNSKCSKNSFYASDYHAIKNWVERAVNEDKMKIMNAQSRFAGDKDRTQRDENGNARKYEFTKVNV